MIRPVQIWKQIGPVFSLNFPVSLLEDRFKFRNPLPFFLKFPFPVETKALDDGREERRRLRTLIAQGFRGVSRHLPRLLHPMKRSKFRVIEQVLGFFESVLMSCFFGCFRIKDDARRKTDSCANSISSEDRV